MLNKTRTTFSDCGRTNNNKMRNKCHHQRQPHHLAQLKLRLVTLTLIVSLYLCCQHVGLTKSVIMPPRLHSSEPSPPPATNLANAYQLDDVPYLLSINEGKSLDVSIQSQSSFTINLNRACPQDVQVLIQIYSGPELVEFYEKDNNRTSSSNRTITYLANQFGDRTILFKTGALAGHAEVVCSVVKQPGEGITIDDSSAYISVNIYKSYQLNLLIQIVGWVYFFAWSLSFYFQVILNYQRKSVVGLNFDFLALNLLGFVCYFIYNFSFMFSRVIQNDYYKRNKYTRIPVEYNDLFFAAHALLLTVITVLQCFIYKRGDAPLSQVGKALAYFARTFIGLSLGVGFILLIVHLFNGIAGLDVVIYLSLVKLVATLIKYTPQAYMNYARKSTTGWSIHNILLDFTGGVLSVAQMFFIAYNYEDWISIFGNFTKFGLGVISIAFDVIFFIQHYNLYSNVGQLDVSTESIPSPVISESILSVSYRQPSHGSARDEEQGDDGSMAGGHRSHHSGGDK